MSSHQDDAQFLVDARWIREHRGDRSVILIDTRPAAEYWAGHLAGARHFDPFPFHYYDTSEKGLREFRAQLEWIFSALGVTSAATVVFYEQDSGMRAARGAWALEYMGHRAVRILDGGLKLAAQELVTSAEPFAPSDFRAEPRAEAIASYDYILKRIGRRDVSIFDVRSDAEYYGENVRARFGGAIPGAFHLEWTNALDSNGAFKPAAELRAAFEQAWAAARHRGDPVLPGRLSRGARLLRAQAGGIPAGAQLHGLVGGMGQSRGPADRKTETPAMSPGPIATRPKYR